MFRLTLRTGIAIDKLGAVIPIQERYQRIGQALTMASGTFGVGNTEISFTQGETVLQNGSVVVQESVVLTIDTNTMTEQLAQQAAVVLAGLWNQLYSHYSITNLDSKGNIG